MPTDSTNNSKKVADTAAKNKRFLRIIIAVALLIAFGMPVIENNFSMNEFTHWVILFIQGIWIGFLVGWLIIALKKI